MPFVSVTTVFGQFILRDWMVAANEDVFTLFAKVGTKLGYLDFEFSIRGFGCDYLFQIDDCISKLPEDCILVCNPVPPIVEEFESLTLLQQELDPYIGITVKVPEDNINIRGEVKDIKFGKTSGVRLYTIMYEDGVVEDYTLMRLLIFADPRGIDAMALKRAWAGKIPCSVCKKRTLQTELGYCDGFQVFLCTTCHFNGYWFNALETHQCGHCDFAGGSLRFDLRSLKASQEGALKKCLRCGSPACSSSGGPR